MNKGIVVTMIIWALVVGLSLACNLRVGNRSFNNGHGENGAD